MNTEYELNLYEVRPEDANPNDIVLSTPPVFQITTNFNQYIYGIADPPLIEGMQYAWRVRAIDITGRDAFRNQGFSEVCSFTYKGSLGGISTGLVENFTAEGKTQSRADFAWQADSERFDGYRIEYKKVGEGYHWFPLEIRSGEQDYVKVFDVGPSTAYEARIQGKKDGFYGPYSEIIPFTTPAIREFTCGQNTYNPLPPGAPLTNAYTNMVVDAYSLEMTCTEITPLDQPGWFKGKGYVKWDLAMGANFEVTYKRIQIDENLRVLSGEIYFVTTPITGWIDDKDGNQSEAAQIQAQNQANWKGVDFYHVMITYYAYDIDSVTFDPSTGELYLYPAGADFIIHNEGIPAILLDNPEDAVIIKDRNGDQWVIDKDGKVHEVKGGGLSPSSIYHASAAAKDILKAALTIIHQENTQDTVATLQAAYEQLDASFKALIPLPEMVPPDQRPSYPSESYFEELGQELATDDQTSPFTDLAQKRITALLAYQKAYVLHQISDESLSQQELNMLAGELYFAESKTLNDFVKTQKSAGESLEDITLTVKQTIETLIQNILIKLYQYENY